jgi:HK97 family phage portal protein
MHERTTSAGLAVVEHRSLRPPVTPNDTVPPESDPGTVGVADTVIPGDPNGVGFDESWAQPGGVWPPSIIRPSAWSGWPGEWDTPNWWGRTDPLTDLAWACVDLNASVLSTMPPYLVNAAESLDATWIDNPDPDLYTSWEEFAKQLFWDYQLGEAFVLPTAWYSPGYPVGWPARFHVVEPWMIEVDIDGDGMRRYTLGTRDVTDMILHIRYTSRRSDARGHGPLEAGRARLIAARMLGRYAANFAAAGGVPNAVLKHPDELTAKQSFDLQMQWVQSRMQSMGLPAVLSGGVEFETVTLSPRDMALTDLLQLTESRIAVLLGVPPFLMGLPSGGDSMTYSNVSSLFDYHWRAGLRPKAQTVMQALSQWALPRGTRVEVNRDAYIQPGPLDRAQTYATLHGIVDNGAPAITVPEVRLAERFDTPATTARPGVLT